MAMERTGVSQTRRLHPRSGFDHAALHHAGMKKAELHAAAPPEGFVSTTGALP